MLKKRNIKIIAVDDDALVRKILSDIFFGDYSFYIAADAEEFFREIEAVTPDIVLIDVILPDENGINICRKIRSNKLFEKTYILMLTAYEDQKTIEDAYKEGANDYIRKPFNLYELNSKIKLIAKTIEFQNKVINLYKHQKQSAELLMKINELIKININLENGDEIFDSFRVLAEIIMVDSCELVFFEVEKKNKEVFSKNDYIPADYRNIFSKIENSLRGNLSIKVLKTINKRGVEIFWMFGKIEFNHKYIGVVVFQNKNVFIEDTKNIVSLYLDFINILGSEIESKKNLYAEVSKERKERSKVRGLQAILLPDFKEINTYDVASSYIPMDEISGDFLDGFYASESLYIIVLCDVSGHGIASSYIGSSIRAFIRSIDFNNKNLGVIVKEINELFFKNLSNTFYFSSLILCSIDLVIDKIVMVSAGHPPCFYFQNKKNEFELLEKNGPLIGLSEDSTYGEHQICIESGDCLFMYTDGITEAHTGKGYELYGEARLYKLFKEITINTSIDIIHTIVGNVYEFTEYESLYDDVSAICIKKK